jgi:ferric-dicitrate binding protein FerR (iron transport regulator)
MTRDRALELLARLGAEGTLPPSEETDLMEALRQDASLAETVGADLETDGLLRSLALDREDPEAFVRGVEDCIAAERDAEPFVGRVHARVRRAPRRARGTRSSAGAWGWIAAGVAAAAILAFLVSSTRRDPPTPRVPETVRATPAVEELPPPPPEPKPAPAPESPPPPPVPEPRPEPPPPPSPAPEPVPIPKPDPVPAPPPPPTVTVVARVERADGEAFLIAGAERAPVKAGDGVASGQGVEGAATLLFPDGTRFETSAGAVLRDLAEGPQGKTAFLAQGSLSAAVPRQPADRPLVVSTPAAEVRVLGTSFRLSVEAGAKPSARLDVKEGKVRLRRSADGKTVDVAAGQFAVAAPGSELAARPVSSERRILYRADFEDPVSISEWELGAIEKARTFNRSRGALRATGPADSDYGVHAEMAFRRTPLPFTISEKTFIRFSYFTTTPGEIKVQLRGDRTNSKTVIAHVLTNVRVNAWTTVTLRVVESFRARAGLGDPVRPGLGDLDNLQFHAGPDGRPAELLVDDIEILE